MNDPNGWSSTRASTTCTTSTTPPATPGGTCPGATPPSTDLVHWKEQPLAISTDDQEDIFSGSVVVDKDNTSGFGTQTNPPLIAIYTSAYKDASPHRGLQAQSLAYSLDDGQTWTKYSSNPVLNRNSANFRDPKVFWYGSTGRRRLLGDDGGGGAGAQGGPLQVRQPQGLDGAERIRARQCHRRTVGMPGPVPARRGRRQGNIKWVMVVNINPGGVAGGSAGQYFVGNFDGTTFTSDTTKPAAALPPGTVLAGFNDGTYNGWTVNNEPGNWKNGPFGDAPPPAPFPARAR